MTLRLFSLTTVLVVLIACGTEVTYVGPGGGGNNTGANNTGANNTGANNTGANNTGANNNTGAGSAVDCVTANNNDPCNSPGSYCSYYDAATNEYCDAYCQENLRWQKDCYTEPTYCYDPDLCPSSMPIDGTACQTTDECEYYDCEFYGACGGSGYGYGTCQEGIWYTYTDCYCNQPTNLCPASPPTDGTSCTTTAQCEWYDCEWVNACGNNTYHYASCDYGLWFSNGDC